VKWVKNFYSQVLKFSGVSRRNNKPVYPGRSRNHCIFYKVVRFAMNEARILPEAVGIHGKNFEHPCNLFQPCFDFSRFYSIMLSSLFYALLKLANGNGGEKHLPAGKRLEPGEDCAVRPGFPEFRNNVCIEQVH
jgi:hypothetical protein